VLGSSLLLWRTSGSGSEKQIGIASVPVQTSKYKLQGFSFCSAVFCKMVPVSIFVLKINPSLNPVGTASVPVQIANYKLQGLSESAPMTAPVPFWIEGNSSIDFGLANHLQQFHFAQVFKKEVPFFLPFFFKPVLQTYQPHSRACNPSYSSPSCIFGGPNTLMSSVSGRKTHNSISSAITCSSVSSIVSLPSLVLM